MESELVTTWNDLTAASERGAPATHRRGAGPPDIGADEALEIELARAMEVLGGAEMIAAAFAEVAEPTGDPDLLGEAADVAELMAADTIVWAPFRPNGS